MTILGAAHLLAGGVLVIEEPAAHLLALELQDVGLLYVFFFFFFFSVFFFFLWHSLTDCSCTVDCSDSNEASRCWIPILITTFPRNLSGTYPWRCTDEASLPSQLFYTLSQPHVPCQTVVEYNSQ